MDRYTKAVLTVIAASLAVIAFKLPATSPAAAFGEGCGSVSDPCYVDSMSTLPVKVENWPMRFPEP